jgi:hypothetical protein
VTVTVGSTEQITMTRTAWRLQPDPAVWVHAENLKTYYALGFDLDAHGQAPSRSAAQGRQHGRGQLYALQFSNRKASGMITFPAVRQCMWHPR